MGDFKSLNLPEALVHKLDSIDFTKPTPIQAQAIPHALEGRDILGSAQTGTGKTAAFAIPIITKLMANKDSSALILTPTRELATQVLKQVQVFMGKKNPIKSALLIGGEPMPKQFSQLRAKPRIVVGTPGRVCDHLKRKTLNLHKTDFLVLDETDRMLDMGFTIQIEEILGYMPNQDRQTLLFSATLPKNIVKIAEKYLKDPVRVAVKSESKVAENVTQKNLKVTESEKYETLLSELEQREGSIIIFIKTKFATERMAKKLHDEGHKADAIHGDLRQSKRDKVIKSFRNQKYRILVATDVAARGLDIPHIEHVINYDMPQCPEDYVHRIGRTARAGAKGEALNLISKADNSKWFAIEKMLNPDLKRERPSSNDNKRNNKKRRFNNKFGDNKERRNDEGRRSFAKKTFGNNKPKRKFAESA